MNVRMTYKSILPLLRMVGLLLLLLFIPVAMNAQVVLMPVNGHADTTMSYAEVYDDGGSTGAYSTNCNSSYTFHTVSSSGRYYIELISSLTHPSGNAFLQIKDGDTNSINLVTSPPNNTAVYYSSSSTVTLVFNSDDDYPTDGFEVILCEFDNHVPQNLVGAYIDSNTYYLSWLPVNPPVMWVVDYAVVGEGILPSDVFSDSTLFQSIVIDTTYWEFNVSPVGNHLVYRIYSIDSSSSSICPQQQIGAGTAYSAPVACPCIMPQNIQIIELADSVTIVWTTDTVANLWHVIVSHLGIDTVLNGNVMHITIPHDYPCETRLVFIIGNCVDKYCNGAYINLPVGGCLYNVGGIQRLGSNGHSVTLSWGQVADPQARYLLYYRRQGQPSSYNIIVDTLPYDSTTYVVDGLDPHTGYTFTVHVLCSDGRLGCTQSTANYATTLDNCIDFINLYDEDNVHRTWGTYSDPAMYTFGNASRHVAIVDTSLRDAHTGNLLRCIPPGEVASFRLGDDNVGAQGETITYDYLVDSLDKDMLVLKYAVVMQNSNHTSINQPHVTMELLDAAGNIIDTTCCYADFYAAGDLGWNNVPGTNIIWKDWSTVGIDIAPYHGQQIKIRFTTTDCADGGHFGYAYFNIHCDSKRIDLVNLCESVDSVTLRAPLGFDYCWTHGSDTTCFSTQNEIKVPADLTEYRCRASFVGKPECSFSIHSLAVLPVPLAAMHYEIDTCGQRIRLFSDCSVSIDSAFRPYVHQTIDSVSWLVDGDIYYGDTIEAELRHNGFCHIKVSCKLSDSYCADTLTDSVWVNIYHRKTIVGDTVACFGDTLTLSIAPPDTALFSFAWDNGSHDMNRQVVVISDTILSLVSNFFMCSDTLHHTIHVMPFYNDTLYVDACPGELDTIDFHESTTGVFTHINTDMNGCDSLSTLSLSIHPAYYDTVTSVVCDESFINDEFNEDSTGFYTHYYTTVWGCDSVYNLDFVRNPVWRDTIVAEILYGDTYIGYHFNESETGFYSLEYTDINGCDSIQNLDLSVILLRFPNAVTPNGDGINDRFAIVNLLDATIFDYNCLWVYDRWGKLIYKKENIFHDSDFWDPDKTNTPDGTYFYRFFARAYGHIIDHKSSVEVIR
ncbi:MAG: gliding motility-associated C-terminal domain-containing protein [Bacteroidales bacterium]|nr:gliding motility-associated C-terminal domain-containing protein [Bacteroidales bacterium]